MKEFIKARLAAKTRKFIATHKPIIVAVTGSVGKTTARNAIATILSAKYHVAPMIENYNNEVGVPLAILGFKSPGRSIIGWIHVLLANPKPAQVYVLEYAIDHPGDMRYLCELAKPSVAVMTAISPVHVEFFRSIEQLAEEKAHLLECVLENGLVVMNADDPRVMGLRKHAKVPVKTFGFREGADVRALEYHLETRQDFSFELGEKFSEIHTKIQADHGDVVSVTLENQLGKTAVSAFLAAVAVAKHLGLTWEEILSKVPELKQEAGRMNPIAGIKGCLIIDSTYNAAPASMVAALNVLKEFQTQNDARRIAVLGHMAELGNLSEQEHHLIGQRAQEVGADILVTVGELGLAIRRGAIEAGMDEMHTQHFQTAIDAGRWLDMNVKKGDIVLVKGSQSARMERVVRDIMADPLRASQVLVRQTGKWVENE